MECDGNTCMEEILHNLGSPTCCEYLGYLGQCKISSVNSRKGNVRIMEMIMENYFSIVYPGCIGIMEKKLESTS